MAKVIKGKKISKTARASTFTAPVAEKVVLTPAQAIQEIRNLRYAGLFVGNMEYVDRLLAEYDRVRVEIAEALVYINAHSKYETFVDLHAGLQGIISSLENEVDALQEENALLVARVPSFPPDELGARFSEDEPYVPEPPSIIGRDEIIV